MRDQKGAIAVFQNISANPTTIHTVDANIAYGAIPGHSIEAADAVRAYLKSKLKTYARIPV